MRIVERAPERISDEQLLEQRELVRGHVLGRLASLDADMDELIDEVRATDPKHLAGILRVKLQVLKDMANVAGLLGGKPAPRLPEPEPDVAALEAAAVAERLESERLVRERAAVVEAARARILQELGSGTNVT